MSRDWGTLRPCAHDEYSPVEEVGLADRASHRAYELSGDALLKEIVAQTGVTVVVASHDPNVHEAADWVFELQDGRLVGTANQIG